MGSPNEEAFRDPRFYDRRDTRCVRRGWRCHECAGRRVDCHAAQPDLGPGSFICTRRPITDCRLHSARPSQRPGCGSSQFGSSAPGRSSGGLRHARQPRRSDDWRGEKPWFMGCQACGSARSIISMARTLSVRWPVPGRLWPRAWLIFNRHSARLSRRANRLRSVWILTFAGKFGANGATDPAGRIAMRLSTEMSLRNKPAGSADNPATAAWPRRETQSEDEQRIHHLDTAMAALWL